MESYKTHHGASLLRRHIWTSLLADRDGVGDGCGFAVFLDGFDTDGVSVVESCKQVMSYVTSPDEGKWLSGSVALDAELASDG